MVTLIGKKGREKEEDDRAWKYCMRLTNHPTFLFFSPGHADYIKNMITGAAQMDGA
jgi:translation elongation factor EF-1alpha